MNQHPEKPLHKIQREIFRSQILLIITMTVILTVTGSILNLYYERKRLDQNLQNVAETIAGSLIIRDELKGTFDPSSGLLMTEYLDSLKKSLSNIDVISVIQTDGLRCYHSNPYLIGTVYDGTLPEFKMGERDFYVSDDTGPSGDQRRAYAAIYSEKGEYMGFVLAVMLQENILKNTLLTLAMYILCALIVILLAVLLSVQLSGKIKKQLLGYEPDTFTAMFKIRDNILESLEEGVLAVDNRERVVFMNHAASEMLQIEDPKPAGKLLSELDPTGSLHQLLTSGETKFNFHIKSMKQADILSDCMPIMEQGNKIGAVGIFRNRTEYTKLMENLTGVRYLVDSMRANNHDFTNKLHVILGLIQMEQYQEAVRYIMNVTMVQRETIHQIMESVGDSSVAALLIGKNARASELNIKFSLKTGSALSREDIDLPSGDLVTIIGNLLDNAMDSMNEKRTPPKELTVGIFTNPHTMLITVDDTGKGISKENLERIFENGFSTKGTGRGTGLYLVKDLVESHGGTISVESEEDVGTSFIISFKEELPRPKKEK